MHQVLIQEQVQWAVRMTAGQHTQHDVEQHTAGRLSVCEKPNHSYQAGRAECLWRNQAQTAGSSDS
jgi:hypothetical protein